MTSDALKAIKQAQEDKERIEWTGLDTFRIWYYHTTDEGAEAGYKTFIIKELSD